MKKPPEINPTPNFFEEQLLLESGCRLVAGLDEVGRGCLAGPVVAAAVVLNPQVLPWGINDSKKLSPLSRKEWDSKIKASAISFSIGFASAEEIDQVNILQASKLAMIRAIENLTVAPEYLLIDGNFKISHPLPQKSVVKGDSLVLSIAAASILAKVFRDEWMRQYDLEFPGYAFAQNKGYGSISHREALMAKGFSPIHRKTFQWKSV